MQTTKSKVVMLKDYQGFSANDICEIVYTRPKSTNPNDGWHTVVHIATNKSSVIDMEHENVYWKFIDKELEDAAKEYPLSQGIGGCEIDKTYSHIHESWKFRTTCDFKAGWKAHEAKVTSEAIEFADWIDSNNWIRLSNDNWWKKYTSENAKNTEHLYKIWQENK